MNKEIVHKMPFDILKIVLFCVSCPFFAFPFLLNNKELCLNMPSNGILMLLLFMLSALFESLDKIVDEYRLPRKKKILNIIEIYMAFTAIMGTIIFFLLDNLIAISTIAVACSLVYFIVKLLRLGRIFKDFYIG